MTHSLEHLDWIRGRLWPSLLRMENPRFKKPMEFYEASEAAIDRFQTVKGHVDHLLSKTRNASQRIKWDHQRHRDFHSLLPDEMEQLHHQRTPGEAAEDDDEERLAIRYVLDRILPPVTWIQDDVVLEQRTASEFPLRFHSILTEQQFQDQMDSRFAHPSAFEICEVRSDIHEELGKEMKRELTCIEIRWGLVLHQILLEEEEVIFHLRNRYVTAVEFGLAKLNETDDALSVLKAEKTALKEEVAGWQETLREMEVQWRNLEERVKTEWDTLTANNKREKDELKEQKDILKDGIKVAARFLRNSFLWDEYDTMPIEEDIKEALMQELKEELERKEREEFEFGESVETAVLRDVVPVVPIPGGFARILIDVDQHAATHNIGKYVKDLSVFEAVEPVKESLEDILEEKTSGHQDGSRSPVQDQTTAEEEGHVDASGMEDDEEEEAEEADDGLEDD